MDKRYGCDQLTLFTKGVLPDIGGREQTRTPIDDVIGNHVADIVKHHGAGTDLVPESLTAFIAARQGRGADEGYDYHQHAIAGSDNVHYVTDAITESFCLIGPAEAHVEKIRALEAAGVTQFTLYLMTEEQERLVGEYATGVLPHLR